MKDYIAKTTSSLQAAWSSRNILYILQNGKSGCLFISFYENTGAMDEFPRS